MLELRVEAVISHLPLGMALRAPSWDLPEGRRSEAAERVAAVLEELRAAGDRPANEA